MNSIEKRERKRNTLKYSFFVLLVSFDSHRMKEEDNFQQYDLVQGRRVREYASVNQGTL